MSDEESPERPIAVMGKALKYSQHGEPLDVLSIVDDPVLEPVENEVLVKMLAAPIHPIDVITIRGDYGIQPPLPAYAGSEGVGEVVSIGNKVKKLCPGQRVVLHYTGVGVWRTHIIVKEERLFPVSDELDLAMAATFVINPCTAYRLLKQFINLTAYDCVIINAANSGVGRAMHQFCKAWNLNSVGVVRDRPHIAELKKEMLELGALEVLTEEELRTTKIFEDGTLPRPCLAFNCVGGECATELIEHLTKRGFLVTFGSLSNDEFDVPAWPLIFKDITLRGFWLKWVFDEGRIDIVRMFKDLHHMIDDGELKAQAHVFVPFEQFKENAVDALTMKGFTEKKYILKFD